MQQTVRSRRRRRHESSRPKRLPSRRRSGGGFSPWLELLEDRALPATLFLSLSLDPSQSHLDLAGDLAGQFAITSQPGLETLSTSVGGSIDVLYDDVARTIDITGARVTPRDIVDERWGFPRYLPPGTPFWDSTAPAQFALEASVSGQRALGALRAMQWTLDSPLLTLAGDQSFAAADIEGRATQGRLDYQIGWNQRTSLDLVGRVSTMDNAAALGSWNIDAAQGLSLELPIDFAMSLPLGSLGLAGDARFRFSGTLVASAGLVDLAVTSTTIIEPTVTAPGEVTLRYTIANGGLIDSGPVDVELYLAPSGFSLDDPYVRLSLGLDQVANIGAGQSVTREVSVAIPALQFESHVPPLTHWIGVFVDPANRIAELDESNNDPSTPGINLDSVLVSRVELHPIALNMPGDPAGLVWGGPVVLEYGVQNIGSGVAGTFRIDFFLEVVDVADSRVLVGSERWDGLGAGTARLAHTILSLPSAPIGTPTARYRWVMLVDAGNEVGEYWDGSEWSNTRVTWNAPFAIATPGPNLAITNVQAFEPSVGLGESVTVAFTVANLGPLAAGPARIRVGEIGSVDSMNWVDIPALAPGQEWTAEVGCIVTRKASGSVNQAAIGLLADAEEAVGETDESDNVATVRVDLELPDLVVSELTLVPTTVDWGATFTAHYRIDNIGERSAGASALTLRLEDEAGAPIAFPIIPIVPMAAGGFIEGSVLLQLPASNVGRERWRDPVLSAHVDAADLVAEANDANNQGRGAGIDQAILVIPFRDLAITSLTVDADQLLGDRDIPVRFIVTNLGNTPTGPVDGVLTYSYFANHRSGDRLARIAFPSLAPSESVTLETMVRIPTYSIGSGWTTGWFGVEVDSYDVLAEPDEANNFAFQGLPIARPDLHGVSFALDVTEVAFNEEFSVHYSIVNSGTADSGPVTVTLFATDQPNSRGSNETLQTLSFAGLAAGATLTGTARFSFARFWRDQAISDLFLGSLVWVTGLPEQDTSNNRYVGLGIDLAKIHVKYPDLRPDGLWIEQASVDWGQSFTAHYAVVNAGSATSLPAELAFHFVAPSDSGSNFGRGGGTLVPALLPGQRWESVATFQLSPRYLDPRDPFLRGIDLVLEVDAGEDNPELGYYTDKESNRIGIGRAVIPIRTIDLVLEDLVVAEPVFSWGQTVHVSAVARNSGTRASSAASIEGWVSNVQGSPITPTQARLARVAALAPGEAVPIEFTFTLPPPSAASAYGRPRLTFRITGDAIEQDDDNNVFWVDRPIVTLESEPNDTFAGSNYLALGTTARGVLAATADIDRFVVAPNGLTDVYFSIRALAGGLAPRARLLDSGGNPVLTLAGGGPPQGIRLQNALYYLEIAGAPGAYELTVEKGSASRNAIFHDFDRDGVLDLLSMRSNGDSRYSLVLERGLGNGGFVETQVIPGQYHGYTLTQRDVTGDGLEDILVGGSGFSTVFIQKADGGFTRRWIRPASSNLLYAEGLQGPHVADLDGDGDLDYVRIDTNLGARDIEVYLGDGPGGHEVRPLVSPLLPAPRWYTTSSFELEDFDGDGLRDILVPSRSFESSQAGMDLFRGLGDGRFTFASPLVTGHWIETWRGGDFDGDGDRDLVFHASANPATLALYANDGAGGFTRTATITVPYSIHSHGDMGNLSDLIVRDLDRDGRADIIAIGGQPLQLPNKRGVAVFLSDAEGTPRFSQGLAVSYFGNQAIADLDNDGWADLLADGEVWLGGPKGFRSANPPDEPAVLGPNYSLAADFNHDGWVDLVTASSTFRFDGTGTLSVLRGLGTGSFEPAIRIPIADPAPPAGLVAADFNGDGNLDLAVLSGDYYHPTGSLAIYLGLGDGRFALSESYASGRNPVSLVVADFDGDGHVDLAHVMRLDNSLRLYFGGGDGTFEIRTIPNISASQLTPIDFSGDGLLDFVQGLLVNTGDRSFRQLGYLGVVPSYSAVYPPAVDIDRDGYPDLLYGRPLLVKPGGTFVQLPLAPWENRLNVLAAGDLDGDGWADIVSPGWSRERIRVLWGQAGGAFDSGDEITLSDRYEIAWVSLADFNNDGLGDIAVTTEEFGSSAKVLLNIGQRRFARAQDLADDRRERASAIVDVTGDGLADYVRLDGDGRVVVLARQAAPPGSEASFAPPVVLNPSFVAFDFAVLRAPDGGFRALALLDSSAAAVRFFTWAPAGGPLPGQAGAPAATAISVGLGATHLAAADLDGNGSDDLVVIESVQKMVRVIYSDSAGIFTGPSITRVVPVGNLPSDIGFGDLDGDGLRDIFVANARSGAIAVLPSRSGHAAVADRYAVASWGYRVEAGASGSMVSSAHDTRRLLVADFDGDGRPDVLAASSGTWSITHWAGNALGGLTRTQAPVDSEVQVVNWQAGDLDGDGRADVAALVRTIGGVTQLRVYFAGGGVDRTVEPVGPGARSAFASALYEGPFTSLTLATVSTLTTSLALGDLDGDGDLDLVVGEGAGSTTVYLTAGSPVRPPSSGPRDPAASDPSGRAFTSLFFLFVTNPGITSVFPSAFAGVAQGPGATDSLRPMDVSESGPLSRRSFTNNSVLADSARSLEKDAALWAKWLTETLGGAVDSLNRALGTRLTTEDFGRLGGAVLRLLTPSSWPPLSEILSTFEHWFREGGQVGAPTTQGAEAFRLPPAAVDAAFHEGVGDASAGHSSTESSLDMAEVAAALALSPLRARPPRPARRRWNDRKHTGAGAR